MNAIVHRLCAAGAIASVRRVGHAPFDTDDPLEIAFANGELFHVEIGIEAATDTQIREGPLLEEAFGHLRQEEPDTFANIARDWTGEDVAEAGWVLGKALSNPRRLAMTQPYRIDVGYVFACGGKELALFGIDDLIFITALYDPEIETFQLAVGASIPPLG